MEITDASGLEVGQWFAFCCEEDLKQIETEAEIKMIAEAWADDDLKPRVWDDEYSAMVGIGAGHRKSSGGHEVQINAVTKTGRIPGVLYKTGETTGIVYGPPLKFDDKDFGVSFLRDRNREKKSTPRTRMSDERVNFSLRKAYAASIPDRLTRDELTAIIHDARKVMDWRSVEWLSARIKGVLGDPEDI